MREQVLLARRGGRGVKHRVHARAVRSLVAARAAPVAESGLRPREPAAAADEAAPTAQKSQL